MTQIPPHGGHSLTIKCPVLPLLYISLLAQFTSCPLLAFKLGCHEFQKRTGASEQAKICEHKKALTCTGGGCSGAFGTLLPEAQPRQGNGECKIRQATRCDAPLWARPQFTISQSLQGTRILTTLDNRCHCARMHPSRIRTPPVKQQVPLCNDASFASQDAVSKKKRAGVLTCPSCISSQQMRNTATRGADIPLLMAHIKHCSALNTGALSQPGTILLCFKPQSTLCSFSLMKDVSNPVQMCQEEARFKMEPAPAARSSCGRGGQSSPHTA